MKVRMMAVTVGVSVALVATGCLRNGEDYRLDHPVHEDQAGWLHEANAVTFTMAQSQYLSQMWRGCGGTSSGNKALTLICTSRSFGVWLYQGVGGAQDRLVSRVFLQSVIDWSLPLWTDALYLELIGGPACFRLPWSPAPQRVEVVPC
jgi:hypothetical protein